jgi:amino acid permease
VSAEESEQLTREDVLDGLFAGHARAAGACLLAIESRTAYLTARSRQAMERFLTEQAAEEREMAFLEALALGRDPPLRPTIQDLERHATQWASMVPDNPMVRAAMAHLLTRRYEFTHEAVPGIRASLGLDDEVVRQAYRRLYQEPLESIFSARAGLVDRTRWAWSALGRRLESLSPFWTAFSLTLTETVGAGILALPIALAGLGPLAGVVLLLVLGLVNLVTILALVEALTRNANVRYGDAYFGRLVEDYLGRGGSLVLSFALLILGLGSLLARYIGLAATLRDATRIPAEVWAVLLLLVGLYLLRRRSLSATVAAALLVGAVNIGVILMVSLIAVAQVRLSNLTQPIIGSVEALALRPSVLGLVFGVVLLAYFGHTSAGNCARIVLRRDPSGRSLRRGNIAAIGAAMGLYTLWLLVLEGAIGPQALVGETGTVLTPLATVVGPVIFLLGSIFVILALGMGSIHDSLALLNQIRERLPTQTRRVVVLPRGRGRLLLHTRGLRLDGAQGVVRLGLAYLGFGPASGGSEPSPHFRLDLEVNGTRQHLEFVVMRNWDITTIYDRLPALGQHRVPFGLAVLEASDEHVRVRINSSLRMTYEGEWYAPTVSTADALQLGDSDLDIITWMVRLGTTQVEAVSMAEVAEHLGESEPRVQSILERLVQQGMMRELEFEGTMRYQARLASRRRHLLPEEIDVGLADRDIGPARQGLESALLLRAREAVLGSNGRFLISVSPVIFIFLLAEWLFLTQKESFSGPLSFAGTIAASVVSGFFPLLLLIASRRKADYVPGSVLGLLGQPFLVAALYLFFLVSLILHGTIIWQNPSERAAALAVAFVVVAATISMRRRGSFDSRLVMELREDLTASGEAAFAVTAGGEAVMADVELGYEDEVRRVQGASGDIPRFSALTHFSLQLPATEARELKVWTHRINPFGDSEAMPALLEVQQELDRQEYDLGLTNGQVVLPLRGGSIRLVIDLPR